MSLRWWDGCGLGEQGDPEVPEPGGEAFLRPPSLVHEAMPEHAVGGGPDDVPALLFRHRELPGPGCLGGHHPDADQALATHLLDHCAGGRLGPGGGLHHQKERRDALGGPRRHLGMEDQASPEVGLGPERTDLVPLVEHDLLVVATDGDVPGPVEELGLGAEGGVDGFRRDAGRGCDGRDGGSSVPLFEEEPGGRRHDGATAGGSLATAPAGVVGAATLDRFRHVSYTFLY